MAHSIITMDSAVDPLETYRLAEAVDLLYRRLRNMGLPRRYVHMAALKSMGALMEAAMVIIKATPKGKHPVDFVNDRRFAVLRVVSKSALSVICLGTDARRYNASRGYKVAAGGRAEVVHTAPFLPCTYTIFSVSKTGKRLRRIVSVNPKRMHFE